MPILSRETGHRVGWNVLSTLGLRNLSCCGTSVFSTYNETRCYYDHRQHPGVEGHVALTIDDGLCRHGRERALVDEVNALLREHDATATFFLCADYIKGFEAEAAQMIRDGHEFGNHCSKDHAYGHLNEADFEAELTSATGKIEAIEGAKVRWFRAPQAKYTAAMRKVVDHHGLRHTLGDCYCDDYAVNDPLWISSTLLSQCSSGSIIVLHQPERGFREHTLEALRLLLEGLSNRGLKCVTLSKLNNMAGCDVPMATLEEMPRTAKQEADAASGSAL